MGALINLTVSIACIHRLQNSLGGGGGGGGAALINLTGSIACIHRLQNCPVGGLKFINTGRTCLHKPQQLAIPLVLLLAYCALIDTVVSLLCFD